MYREAILCFVGPLALEILVCSHCVEDARGASEKYLSSSSESREAV